MGLTVLTLLLPISVSTQKCRVLNIRAPLGPRKRNLLLRGESWQKVYLFPMSYPDEARPFIPGKVALANTTAQPGLSKAELTARFRGKDGLICHIISAIDAKVLAAAPTVRSSPT